MFDHTEEMDEAGIDVKKERSKHWFRDVLFFAAIALVISAFVVGFVRQEQMLSQLEKEQEERRIQKEETALQLEEMQRLIEYSGSDEYAEQQARHILDWVREDEILYVDPEQNDASKPVQLQDSGLEEEPNEAETLGDDFGFEQ